MVRAVIFGVSRRCASRAAVVVCLLAASGRAAAEPSADDKALATALFREARTLMTEGHTPEACAKFEESHRLDPSGGTILNLALCHEKEGKLARAWSEFSEAIAFARRDYRADREAEAQDHATKLEPRLSRLTVVVPEPSRIEGLRVERDGHELAAPSWSLAIPVDGGEHVIRASAPGRLPWTRTLELAGEAGTASVEIPTLALAPPPPAPPPTSLERPSSLVAAPSAPEGNPRRTAAWITGAAAAVQLGVASYYGLQAISLKSNVNRNDEAIGDANRSTALTITGVLTAGVSAYLFWTSRHPRHD
jgi:tetratricopeptide (TPR) repeat protein